MTLKTKSFFTIIAQDADNSANLVDELNILKVNPFLEHLELNGDSVIDIKQDYTINPRTGSRHIFYTVVYRENNKKRVLTEKQ